MRVGIVIRSTIIIIIVIVVIFVTIKNNCHQRQNCHHRPIIAIIGTIIISNMIDNPTFQLQDLWNFHLHHSSQSTFVGNVVTIIVGIVIIIIVGIVITIIVGIVIIIVNPHQNQHQQWRAVKSGFGAETVGTATNIATTSKKCNPLKVQNLHKSVYF